MSQGDIDRTYRTEVTNTGKNRSVIVTFVQCNEYYRQRIFTNKKRLKVKEVPITERLTIIRRRELN